MTIDKSLIKSKMVEINRLLGEVCAALPDGTTPSLVVDEHLMQRVGDEHVNLTLTVQLCVQRQPETF